MNNLSTDEAALQTARSRITVGVFATNFVEQYHTAILSGVMDMAHEHNINLIAFDSSDLTPVLTNNIFDLATPDIIDALLVYSSEMTNEFCLSRMETFMRQYPMPIVSFGIPLLNAYNIPVDNETGMRAAIRHLIEVHGYRRIAFICGPELNDEAAVRFQAYKDTLSDFGIAYDPQLVVPGRFEREDGEAAIRILLDERKVEFEAIVGADDGMAIAALEALQKRNIHVPSQVAVVGFDDVEDAQAVIPQLTTVRQPLYEQGKRGVEIVLALLRGESVDDAPTLKTELIVRRSCGCFHQPTLAIQSDSSTQLPGTTLRNIDFSNIPIRNANIKSEELISPLYEAFLADLLSTYTDDREPVGEFIRVLDVIIHDPTVYPAQVATWHDTLSAMRSQVMPILQGDIMLYRRAEVLWQQSRMFVSEIVQQTEANRRLQFKMQARALNKISQELLAVTDMADLAKVMAAGLPNLGIRSCYIALYNDSTYEGSHLIFAYDEYNPEVSAMLKQERLLFRSRELVPKHLPISHRRYSWIVQALHSKGMHLGFIVLEIDRPQIDIYETLRAEISSTLNITRMMGQLTELATLRERERLARDLHDSLGHVLAALAVQLEAVQRLCHVDPVQASAQIDELKTLTFTSMEELRRSLAGMRAPGLGERQLGQAITELCRDVATRTNIKIVCSVEEKTNEFGLILTETIWRIIQEALTNIEKHAHASQVNVIVALERKAVLVRVSDNGIGLASQAFREDRYGLRGMRERIEGLGGALLLKNEGGTLIEAKLPLVGVAL